MTRTVSDTDAGAVVVTQADREAAHKLHLENHGDDWRALLTGREDDTLIVQAFARHRLAHTPLTPKTGEPDGDGWAFDADDRTITCGGAPVFRVYEADDFPCIEDEDRAQEDEWFNAQAQTAVLMLNSLLHTSGDTPPVPGEPA